MWKTRKSRLHKNKDEKKQQGVTVKEIGRVQSKSYNYGLKAIVLGTYFFF